MIMMLGSPADRSHGSKLNIHTCSQPTKWIVYFQPFFRLHPWVISGSNYILPLLRDFRYLEKESPRFLLLSRYLSLYSADGIIWFAGLSESVRSSAKEERSCEHAEYMIMIDEQIFPKVKALERNQNELSSRPLLMPVMFDAFITVKLKGGRKQNFCFWGRHLPNNL